MSSIALGTNLRSNSGAASATAGAATLNNKAGVITSESVTTAAGSNYTLTLTNSAAGAGDIVLWSVDNGTNSAGTPVAVTASPTSGQVVFIVKNTHASAAFNGTIKVSYLIVKA